MQASVLSGVGVVKVPAAIAKRPSWAAGLGDLEYAFVRAYLIDLNATHAYLAVKPHSMRGTASTQGCGLLKRPEVAAAVDAALSSEVGATRTRIVDELAALAFHNPGDYSSWTEDDATFTPSADLDERQLKSVKSVKRTRKVFRKGDTEIETTTMELSLTDKQAALERLGKVIGAFKDRDQIGVAIQINIGVADPNDGDTSL